MLIKAMNSHEYTMKYEAAAVSAAQQQLLKLITELPPDMHPIRLRLWVRISFDTTIFLLCAFRIRVK